MSDAIPFSDFEGGGNSAQFNAIGDKHGGRIVKAEKRVQTDPGTQTVQTFPDGTPKPMIVISVEENDGETRQIYAKGGNFQAVKGEGESMMTALRDALKEAKADALEAGGKVTIVFTGEGRASKPGFNPPKLFRAKYEPPAASSVSAKDLFNE